MKTLLAQSYCVAYQFLLWSIVIVDNGYDFGCPGDWFQMSWLSKWFWGYPNGERNDKAFANTPWWHSEAQLIWCERSYVSPRVLCWLQAPRVSLSLGDLVDQALDMCVCVYVCMYVCIFVFVSWGVVFSVWTSMHWFDQCFIVCNHSVEAIRLICDLCIRFQGLRIRLESFSSICRLLMVVYVVVHGSWLMQKSPRGCRARNLVLVMLCWKIGICMYTCMYVCM